jgi:hypothetical protein
MRAGSLARLAAALGAAGILVAAPQAGLAAAPALARPAVAVVPTRLVVVEEFTRPT